MKYWAFLSYSHADKKWGDWLHKALETYRVPRRLVGKESRGGKVPERVYPIFRDREELPVSADLGSNINESLSESRYLIVICSPRSAQSRWVGEEIKTFKKLGREDRILALIVDGEPNASDGKPGFKVEDECFHEAMRYRLVDGEPSEARSEPIAADAREGKDGKNNAKLKLLAGLLGVNYDDLKQREQERRLRRARRVVAAAIVLIGIFAALSVALFFKEREATRARNEARTTLSRSDFLQAVRAIDDGKTSEALALLARSISFDPENRAALCRLTTLLTYRDYAVPHPRLEQHSVRSAAFSSDGKRIVTASEDKTVRVWDAETGKPLIEPITHDDGVASAQFSPDGKRVLTTSGAHTARVWDTVSGKALSEPMKHDGEIVVAQFSKDGTRVLTTSADAKVSDPPRVWDAQTGKLLSGPMKADENEYVKFAQLSPDGTRLLTVSRNSTARVREAETGEPLSQPMKHQNTINTAEFSSDGKRIVTASEDKTARVWDTETGKPLIEPITHDDSVVSAQFSPDGKRIITLSARLIRIWDAENGKQLLEPRSDNSPLFLNRGSLPSTSSVRFSLDGKRIVTACYDGTAQVWDTQSGEPLTEPMQHDDEVRSAEFSPDGKRIVTVSSNMVRVWDAQTGKPLTEPIKLPIKGEAKGDEIENDDDDDDDGHEKSVVSAEFSLDSKRIVTTSGKIARVWDAESGKPITQSMQHRGKVKLARYSPDGKRIVTIGEDSMGTLSNPIQVWEADTGKALTDPMTHGRVRGASARFTTDGKQVIVTPREGIAVEIWNVETGQELNPQESSSSQEHSLTVKWARFSPDETRIVVTSGVTARVCDVQTGKALTERMKHDGEIKSAQFSPDGKRIVTACADKTARVWDAETGKPLTQPIRHDESVESAQFSSDGKWILTVSGKQVRVWDAQNGKPLTEPMQHGDAVSSAEFSSDGRRILTESGRTARVWDARTSKLLIEPMDAASVHFSPDGSQILDGTARIWDAVPTGRAVCERLSHDDHILSVQVSSDGKRIVTVSEDSTARIWEAFIGRAITNLNLSKQDQWVRSAQFSPDGKRILTRSARSARVWDADTGKPLTEPMKHEDYIESVQFSPDGKSVLTASRDKTAQLWDATTGKRLIPPINHDGPVNVARFSPDGSRIITGSRDRTARVWDAKTGKPLTVPIQHEAKDYSKGDVRVAEFSPDGKRIITAAELGPARIWDAKTAKPLTEPFHLGLGTCAQFDASGNRLVTAGNLAAVVLDSRTGKPLIGAAPVLDGSIDASAEFSPDGTLFITSSRNTSGSADARIWDSATGKPLAEPFKPEAVTARPVGSMSEDEIEWSLRSGVTSAHFNSKGDRIAAALADNKARVWDIMPAGKGSPEWLPRLADAIAGEHLNNRGFFEDLDKDSAEILKELKDKFDKESSDDEWVVWGKWFLANHSTRTISPFSKMTVPEYIEDRIKENTAESLDEAERLAVGDVALLKRIKTAREELGYRRR